MTSRASSFAAFAVLVATCAMATAAPPLAGVWNIAASGNAASSGELRFRVHSAESDDPVEIDVPVMMGASEQAVARNIRRALGSQLSSDRFRVELGEGANVLVSDSRGKPAFALELVDSNVQSLRIAVQSVTPSASPTVPAQAAPAEPEDSQRKPPTRNAPGNTTPPPTAAPPPNSIPLPSPAPVPSGSMPLPSPPPAPSPVMPTPSPTTAAPGNPPPAAPPATVPPAEGQAPANGSGVPPPAPGGGS